jgi:hypothetical protein
MKSKDEVMLAHTAEIEGQLAKVIHGHQKKFVLTALTGLLAAAAVRYGLDAEFVAKMVGHAVKSQKAAVNAEGA